MAFINGGPAIYPAAVASAAGKAPIDIKDYIGTGPYRFGEWKPNRHLELVKFDGYSGPAGDASGYAGQRTAHFDRLRFIPVPDPGTRINGLRAGDYDYAESVPSDLFDELDQDPDVNVVRHRSKCGNSSLHTRAGLSRGTQCSGSGVSNDARARQRPWISAVSARADSRAA